MNKLKVNTSFKWVLERKNFLSKDECIEMKKFIDENAKPSRSQLSKLNDKSDFDFKWGNKDCRLYMAENSEQSLLDRFWSVMTIANEVSYKYDIKGIYHNRIQAQKYVAGDLYNPHSDYHGFLDYSTLKLTSLLFLNDYSEYEGGKFSFFDGTEIEPEVGKIIISPAFYGHELSPITRGTRYSCVGWAVGDTFV